MSSVKSNSQPRLPFFAYLSGKNAKNRPLPPSNDIKRQKTKGVRAKRVPIRDFLVHCKRIANFATLCLFALQKHTTLLAKYSVLYFNFLYS